MQIPVNKIIKALIKNDISVLSYHTRMDASDVGINQYILKKIGLGNIQPFGLSDGDMTGRIGAFDVPLTMDEICQKVKLIFGCNAFTYTSTGKPTISNIAVVSGGGSDYMDSAVRCGADLFISGEFKHHHYLKARELDFPLICIDHFHICNPLQILLLNLKRFHYFLFFFLFQ